MKLHPHCNRVPPMSADEFETLVEDMKANGFNPLFPIAVHNGEIWDGRHRYAAAEKAGVEPITVEVPDHYHDSPAMFIAAANNRRNLTPAQRAAWAADMLPDIQREAKKRQEGGVPAKIPEGRRERESAEIAGKQMKVSGTYVKVAAKAKEEAPAVFEQMKAGEISVAGAKKAMLPPPPAKKRMPPPPPAASKVRDEKARAAIDAEPQFSELANRVHALKRDILAFAGEPHGAAIRAQQIEADMKNVAAAIRFGIPAHQCPESPKCNKKCLCGGRHWLTGEEFERWKKSQK